MRALFTLGALVATVAWMGCSGANEAPIGGPYDTNPNAEVDGGTGASSGGSSGSSSGTLANGGSTSSSGVTSTSSSGGSSSTSSSGGAASSGSSGGSSSGSSSSSSGGSSSGSSSSSSSSGSSSGGAPTWTQIYTSYIAVGTIGNCGSCHSGYGGASAAYTKGGGKTWADPSSSRLTWYGGDMPPNGPSASSAAQAVTDMNAWYAAGGLNN